MNKTCVLALLPLFVVLAQSFPWEIVVCAGDRLKFYNNGVLTHIEENPSAKKIYAVTYDQVHYRVLFADHQNTTMSISSFDPTTRKIQTLVTRLTDTFHTCLAYDPITQLLFWGEDKKIYSISLKPASSNKAVVGNLLVTLKHDCKALAVDSCGGHIYWSTDQKIERAAFDGSEREVIIDTEVFVIRGLAIDQQTQKMYFILEVGFRYKIASADLNGKNRIILIEKNFMATALTISKDFIYWKSYDTEVILKFFKHELYGAAIVSADSSGSPWFHQQLIAANYTIEEQTLEMKSCEALKSLLSSSSETDVSLEGSTCHNYCLQGNCSISDEGKPNCSCEAGYTGERCEVNVCYMYCLHGGVCFLNEEKEPVCQCTADYEGERCEVAITPTGVCACADKTTQQMLQDLRNEVKQVREDLQWTLQQYSDKLDENAAQIQICEVSMNNDLQNHDEATSKTQT